MSDQVDAGTSRNSVTTPVASRRHFLQASLAALGASLPAFSNAAQAQGDAELTRLLAARRVLLKGGIVLSLDRAVGDFTQADVLIEDGKISAVRPNITVTGDATVVVDATNRIVLPGFI